MSLRHNIIENPSPEQIRQIKAKIAVIRPQVELQELYTRLELAKAQQEQAEDHRMTRYLKMEQAMENAKKAEEQKAQQEKKDNGDTESSISGELTEETQNSTQSED